MPDEFLSIRGKRRASSIDRVTADVAAGKKPSERAYVQLGKTNTRIMSGQEDLSLWSDEELKRGQRKDRNGGWRGVPPKVVPKALHDELVRRTMQKAHELLRDNLETAVSVLTELVDDPTVEAKDRLRAVGMIMDRVMGKEPIKMEHGGEMPPWQLAIQAGIVTIKGGDLLASEEEDDGEAEES